MKTLLRRTILFLAGITILLAAFHRIENWRGERAWKAWKAEQSAKGVPFALAEILPPPVADAENFAEVPMVREAVLGTAKPAAFRGLAPPTVAKEGSLWREGAKADLAEFVAHSKAKDLGVWLEPWNVTLDEVAEAARRPKCRLPVDYAKGEIPALLGFRALARTYRMRALWRLQAGDSEGALQDVLACLRISRHFSQEPIFIPQLVRIAMTEFALQSIWEGLVGRKWNERQLAELQAELEGADLLRGYQLAWQGERIFMQQNIEPLLRASQWRLAKDLFALSGGDSAMEGGVRPAVFLFLPKGWLQQNRVAYDRIALESGVGSVDPAGHRILIRDLTRIQDFSQGARRPYSFIAAMALPALSGVGVRIARTQTAVDQALVACAIERHRLAKGALPGTLEDILPGLLKSVPRDLITGESLRYRPAPDGTFLLYASGWNGRDEGGVLAAAPANGNRPGTEGDWPWPALQR